MLLIGIKTSAVLSKVVLYYFMVWAIVGVDVVKF